MNILVTGASRGIGRAIALGLKQIGNVFGTARDESLLKSLNLAGYCLCDLSFENDLVKLGNFIKDNKIDVLVNNAGEYIYSAVDENDLQKINYIYLQLIKK